MSNLALVKSEWELETTREDAESSAWDMLEHRRLKREVPRPAGAWVSGDDHQIKQVLEAVWALDSKKTSPRAVDALDTELSAPQEIEADSGPKLAALKPASQVAADGSQRDPLFRGLVLGSLAFAVYCFTMAAVTGSRAFLVPAFILVVMIMTGLLSTGTRKWLG